VEGGSESSKTNWSEIQSKIHSGAHLTAKKDGNMLEVWNEIKKFHPYDFTENITIKNAVFNNDEKISSVEYCDTESTDDNSKITISDDTNEGKLKLLYFLILYS